VAASLSGGERQRLSIRAVLKEFRRILILDEATARLIGHRDQGDARARLR